MSQTLTQSRFFRNEREKWLSEDTEVHLKVLRQVRRIEDVTSSVAGEEVRRTGAVPVSPLTSTCE